MASVNKWLFNKFKDINHSRMDKHIDIIAKNTGKSRAYIKFDMIRNFITHGSGYTDYFRCDFINRTSAEKKTFATAKTFHEVLDYLNDDHYIVLLNDKLIFDEIFKEYLKRDFINLRNASTEDFKNFLSGKSVVFAKDPTGECGHGISKITVSDIKDPSKLLAELKENGQLLVEDAIVQCDEMNEINPCVVNSFRIVTLYKDGKAHIIANALRVNQDDTDVIGCTNDLYFSMNAEGKIDSNVIDDYANVYEKHPMTGKKFADVKIPGVDKAFEMVKEAAEKIPQVRYIGWDVAFSTKGPVIVEGNEYPGYGILQFYKLKNKTTGHLKEIADVLGNEFKNIKL